MNYMLFVRGTLYIWENIGRSQKNTVYHANANHKKDSMSKLRLDKVDF